MSEVTPIYLYRRKGQPAWATCDAERYEELCRAVHLFDTEKAYSASDYDALAAECERLRGEVGTLYTTMMAAAVEIQEHWDAHCDADGYGPANLMHRLERGIAAQYGYNAETVVRMEAQRDAALAELAALKGGRAAVAYRCHQCKADTEPPKPYCVYVECAACGGLTSATAARYTVTAPPAQASAWVPEGLTAITRSMGRAIVRFKTTEQLNAFYRSMKSAIAAPTPGASDGKGGV